MVSASLMHGQPRTRTAPARAASSRGAAGAGEIFGNCTIDKVETTPTPGSFYQIQRGDTLFGIVSRAVPGVQPGSQRLALARVINADLCNLKFHTTSIPSAEKKMFGGSRISFRPRYGCGAAAQQASSDGKRSGDRCYPVIKIPPGISRLAGVAGESAGGLQAPRELGLESSCEAKRSKIEAGVKLASRAVSRALSRFPAPGSKSPRASVRRAFKEHFAGPSEAQRNFIRAKLSVIGSKLQSKSIDFACQDPTASTAQNPGPRTPQAVCGGGSAAGGGPVIGGQAFPPDLVVLCTAGLDLPCPAFVSRLLIHETAHLADLPGDVYRDLSSTRAAYRSLTPGQAIRNADSYANFAWDASRSACSGF